MNRVRREARISRRAAVSLALVVLIWGRSGIAQQSSAADAEAARYYEDALSQFEQGKYLEAEIQSRNAIQKDSKHLPSRILLGQALLERGNPLQASSEFLLAKSMGADRSLTDVSLARAYLQMGKYRELLKQIHSDGLPPAVAAEVEALRGRAQVQLGDAEAAAASFETADKLNPGGNAPLIGKIIVALGQGKPEKAQEFLDLALAADPEDAEAWFLSGKIAYARGDRGAAEAALDRAVSIRPDYSEARFERALLYIHLDRLTAAQQELDAIRERGGTGPFTEYLQAIIHARTGDDGSAQDAMSRAASAISLLSPDTLEQNHRLLLLAATVSFLQERIRESERHLRSYLKARPRDPRGRQLLAQVLLATDRPQAALEILKPTYDRFPDELTTKSLMARIHVALRDYTAAASFLEEIAASNPADESLLLDLARSRLAGQQVDSAIDALSQAVQAKSGTSDTAAILLAELRLRQGKPEQAAVELEPLLQKEPDNPLALNVLGRARSAAGDADAARAAFVRAIVSDPGYVPAQLSLAKLDIAAGSPDEARARYMGVLERRPSQRDTLISLSELAESEGKLAEAIEWREKISEKRVTASSLKLIELHIKAGDPDRALALAERLQTWAPGSYEVEMALARSEVAAGRRDLARITLTKLMTRTGYDSRRLYRIAHQQIRLGDLENAYWSLAKAVDAEPTFLEAQVELGLTALRLEKHDKALERAKTLQTNHPENAAGYVLEGEVHFAEQRPAEAERAFRQAFDVDPSTGVVVRLYRLQAGDGRRDEALRWLEGWLKEHPGDSVIRELLGKELIRAGRYDEALPVFERLAEQNPRKPGVLNNLAMLYQLEGDERAIDAAQRAYDLAPRNPLYADTLGWILVQRGSTDRGLALLREAQSRQADLPDLAYHIAVALNDLGRPEQARIELEQALATGADFPEIGDAKRLLMDLKSRR